MLTILQKHKIAITYAEKITPPEKMSLVPNLSGYKLQRFIRPPGLWPNDVWGKMPAVTNKAQDGINWKTVPV